MTWHIWPLFPDRLLYSPRLTSPHSTPGPMVSPRLYFHCCSVFSPSFIAFIIGHTFCTQVHATLTCSCVCRPVTCTGQLEIPAPHNRCAGRGHIAGRPSSRASIFPHLVPHLLLLDIFSCHLIGAARSVLSTRSGSILICNWLAKPGMVSTETI